MIDKVINLGYFDFDFEAIKKEFKDYKILEKIEQAGLEGEFYDVACNYFDSKKYVDILDFNNFLEYEEDLILEEVFAKDLDKKAKEDC